MTKQRNKQTFSPLLHYKVDIKRFFKYFFAFFATFSASSEPVQSQNFHLIVFADTDDPGLSAPNRMNIANLELIVDTLCGTINLNKHVMIFRGNDFRATKCDQVISTLRPAAEDIVFFYFMGHGWNNSEREEPMLLFKSDGHSPGVTNSRNLGVIFDELRKKGARLTLAFGESCNSAINDRSKAKKGTGIALNVSDVNAEKLKELFLRSNMSIILQSCKRGQKSNSSEDGGWFFGTFIETYKQIVSNSEKQKPTWEMLLTRTSEATSLYAAEQGARQEPVFHIYPANNEAARKENSPNTKSPTPAANNTSKNEGIPAPLQKGEPKKSSVDGHTETGGNKCAINLTAVSVLQQELRWLEKFKKDLLTMGDAKAVEEYKRYYEPGRQEFFKELVKKLNVGQLDASEVQWFSEISQETAEYLDDTAYYLNHPQFTMKASAKLGIPIENLRNAAARIQDLMRDCK
ncbi:caspase family protein [Dyadobacter jiangsuensis]|uniref:Caspase domain-containing protein n=1 Tax=Dyadobacter jiangsuensis TaxID=1591085 RepID=A0A2P8G0F6_9BACT|nr:caspase family protein [Dyadobacter jiangsuensis]PSL27448.1 caspase domain-containing protein [Dyadobacter jiangsuensis]